MNKGFSDDSNLDNDKADEINNPKTGEKIAIPAKRVPTFSAGKLFKDRVQG